MHTYACTHICCVLYCIVLYTILYYTVQDVVSLAKPFIIGNVDSKEISIGEWLRDWVTLPQLSHTALCYTMLRRTGYHSCDIYIHHLTSILSLHTHLIYYSACTFLNYFTSPPISSYLTPRHVTPHHLTSLSSWHPPRSTTTTITTTTTTTTATTTTIATTTITTTTTTTATTYRPQPVCTQQLCVAVQLLCWSACAGRGWHGAWGYAWASFLRCCSWVWHCRVHRWSWRGGVVWGGSVYLSHVMSSLCHIMSCLMWCVRCYVMGYHMISCSACGVIFTDDYSYQSSSSSSSPHSHTLQALGRCTPSSPAETWSCSPLRRGYSLSRYHIA